MTSWLLLGGVLLGHYLSALTALGLPLFLPRLLEDLPTPVPPWSIGLLYVLPTLCTALAAPLWGWLADRHGCRLSLLRAHAGLALGLALTGCSQSLAGLVLGLVVQGACGGAMAASNAYLATQLQGEALSRALNMTQYSARLAMVSGPLLVGWLAASLGLSLYLYLALLPLLALGVILGLPRDPVRSAVAVEATPGAAAEDAGLYGLLGIQFLFCFAMVVGFPYFVPYSESLGLTDDRLIALFYSLPHLVYLLALPWARHRSGCLLYPGLALLGASSLLQFLLASPGLLLPLRLLGGLGMLLCFVGLHRELAARRREGRVGRLFAWYDACGKWAGALAGALAGLAMQQQGPAMPFLLAAVAAIAALFLIPSLSKRLSETLS